jgi:hypothetical protein
MCHLFEISRYFRISPRVDIKRCHIVSDFVVLRLEFGAANLGAARALAKQHGAKSVRTREKSA